LLSVQFILLNKTKETSYKIGNHMNKQIEELKEEQQTKMTLVFKILNKLEQRIATLEKVLDSHAKGSMQCYNDWAEEFSDRAIDHFGRLTEPKHLNENNAWQKTYDWDSNYENRLYVYRNGITNEQRPLTKAQYNDSNYTLNER
jgi:hypothetical protein